MMFKRFQTSLKSAFHGPSMRKIQEKLTSKQVVVPIVYSLLIMCAFALVYALIGYKNLFVTTEDNEDKNIENSVTASIYLQSNAMGPVTPKNSLGNWLMTAQVTMGWLWYLAFIFVFF